MLLTYRNYDSVFSNKLCGIHLKFLFISALPGIPLKISLYRSNHSLDIDLLRVELLLFRLDQAALRDFSQHIPYRLVEFSSEFYLICIKKKMICISSLHFMRHFFAVHSILQITFLTYFPSSFAAPRGPLKTSHIVQPRPQESSVGTGNL